MSCHNLGYATLKHRTFIDHHKLILTIYNNPSLHCAFPPRWDSWNIPRRQLLFCQFLSNCGIPQYDSLPHRMPFFPHFAALWFPSTLMRIWQIKRRCWLSQRKLSSVSWALDWTSRLIRIQSELWVTSAWPTCSKYLNDGSETGEASGCFPTPFLFFLPLHSRHLVPFARLGEYIWLPLVGQRCADA